MTKVTYSRVQTTGNNAVDASRLRVSPTDLRTIEQALIDAGSSGGGGADLGVEFRTITAGEATNKELTLVDTPGNSSKVAVFVSGGTTQFINDDYTVTGDVVSWNGLGLDNIVVAGTKLVILYPKDPGTPSGGEVTRVQLFETDGVSTVGGNKYVDLAATPTDAESVRVFIVGGSSQINDLLDPGNGDFQIINDLVPSPKRVSWDGLGMESNLAATGTKFLVVYTISTASAPEAVNVQAGPFSGNIPGAVTDVQGALDWLDGAVLGGGGSSILHEDILLVAPNHPEAVDDTDTTTPFLTIQEAMDQAGNEKVILIAPGTYSENLVFPVDKNVYLKGLSDKVVVSGTASSTSSNFHVVDHVVESISFQHPGFLNPAFSISVNSLSANVINFNIKNCEIRKTGLPGVGTTGLNITGFEDTPISVTVEDTLIEGDADNAALSVSIPVLTNNINSILILKNSRVEGTLSVSSRSQVFIDSCEFYGPGSFAAQDYTAEIKNSIFKDMFNTPADPLLLNGFYIFESCRFEIPCNTNSSNVTFNRCSFNVSSAAGNYLVGSGSAVLSSCTVDGTSLSPSTSVSLTVKAPLQEKGIVLTASGATPSTVNGASPSSIASYADVERVVMLFSNNQRAFWSGIRLPKDFNSFRVRFKVFYDFDDSAVTTGAACSWQLRLYAAQGNDVEVIGAPGSATSVSAPASADKENRATAYSPYFDIFSGGFNASADYELYADLTYVDPDGNKPARLRSVLVEYLSNGLA